MYARQERTLEAHTLCWQRLSLVDHQFPFCATWYYLENKNNDQNRIRRLQPSVCSVVMETIQWTFPCGEGKFSSPGKHFYKFGCANLAWKMQGWCTADKWRGGGAGKEESLKLNCSVIKKSKQRSGNKGDYEFVPLKHTFTYCLSSSPGITAMDPSNDS